jgi:hypothetical protein
MTHLDPATTRSTSSGGNTRVNNPERDVVRQPEIWSDSR